MLVYSKLEIDQFIKTHFIKIDQKTHKEISDFFEYYWNEENYKIASFWTRIKFTHLLKK